MAPDKAHIVEKTDLKKFTVSLRSDGIMQFTVKHETNLEVTDVKAIVNTVGKIGKGKKFPNLVVIPAGVTFDKEAREFSAREEANVYTIADAFVIKSLAHKLIGNFYINFDKPVRPTKLFNSQTKAVKWLKTFLKQTKH